MNMLENTTTDKQESLLSQCEQFGNLLGLDRPVSPDVLAIAVRNESYAHKLLVSRKSPEFLDYLIANPPRPPKHGWQPGVKEEEKSFSNKELISKATTALIKWGKTGFTTVDEQTLTQREQACLACPHLSTPKSKLQKLASQKSAEDKLGRRTGNSICTACGCTVSRKMRLPTEACPVAHPQHDGLTRWGEPMASTAVAEA